MSKPVDQRELTELLALDSRLNPEQIALKRVIRDFADRELRPNIAKWFETGEIPARELAKKFGALGLLGMHLDGYECAGSDALSYGRSEEHTSELQSH